MTTPADDDPGRPGAAAAPPGDAVPAPDAGAEAPGRAWLPARSLPTLALLLVVSLTPILGALAGAWSVLAVVFVYVADGAADGVFAWRRARSARGGDPAEADSDRVLIKEFVKTYFTIILTMALVSYMAFGGKLFKPGGKPPPHAFEAFVTWQFWAVIAAMVAVRAFIFWWDFVLGDEARFLPPAAVVSEPLKRLFVLQFGVVVGGLVVYWPFRSASWALAVLVVVAAVANLVLAVLERQRTARIALAVAAGLPAEGRARRDAERPAKARPRGGRRRKRRR